MRNPIFKGGLVVALGLLAMVGCGGSSDDETHGVSKGGSGGSAAGTGKGGNGAGGTGGVIPVGGASGNVGGASGNSNNGGVSGDACVAEQRTGNKAIVALYFMIDISGSMNCHIPEVDPACTTDPNDRTPYPTTRWTEASPALQSFFSSSGSNGMWAGINFFSKNGSCNVRDYATPEVEIAALPGNATAINNAIMAQDPAGATPTVPSLTAAIDHARGWAQDHTDQQAIVVYMTDGYPLGCNGGDNTIANAAMVAADGYSGTPSIRTFVLGIGPNLTDLNQIAMSGGTNNALIIDTSQDVGQQLIDRLNQIREDVVVDCAYTIPPAPGGQTLDYGRVNVSITTGAGDTIDVSQDDPSGTCDSGWEYSPDMSQILLCGTTCDMVKNDPGASLSVGFGCQTIREPP
jgi:hypothetical protein